MKEMIVTIMNEGNFKIELNEEIAPIATASIQRLAKMGKYDGKRVERLEPGFVFQPLFYDGKDSDIDQELEPEFLTNTKNHECEFHKGIVAMAGTDTFACAGQWFVTLGDAPRLNGKFTVIGHVCEGMELVERLSTNEVVELIDEESGFKYHQPKNDIIIEKVVIE